MSNKTQKSHKFQNITIGIAILAFYFWWLFSSGAYSEARESYLMVTKEKITVLGEFIFTEKFEPDIGSGGTQSGYGYKYSFLTQDGRTIENKGWNYGELPTNIEVEYVSENPNISRIKGLVKNDNTLIEWIKNKLVWKLLGFLLSLFLSYKFFTGGIGEWKQ